MSALAMSSGRARWAAFLLSLVGLFGAHRFYLGRYRSGLVMSLTILAGLFSPVWAGTGKMETLPAFAMLGVILWWAVDVIRILSGGLMDAEGMRLGWRAGPAPVPERSRQVATFLVLLGLLGAHRFYLGQIWYGLLMLFTFGGYGVLWLIDLNSLARMFFHTSRETFASSGEPTHAVIGALGFLVRLFTMYAPPYVAVAYDREARDTFRHELWPGYQAKRKPRPDGFQVQLDRLIEIARLHALPVYCPPRGEADDGIATATRIALALGLRVVVVSSDLDLAQLVSDRVWLWNGKVGDTARVHTPAIVEAEFGVPVAKLGDLFALSGDASDGIDGVPGVGPKIAAEWLARFGTLDNVLRFGPSWLKRSARQQALKAHVQQVQLYRELVGLWSTAPIGFDGGELSVGGWRVSKLRELYNVLGFAADSQARGWFDVSFFPKAACAWSRAQVEEAIKAPAHPLEDQVSSTAQTQ